MQIRQIHGSNYANNRSKYLNKAIAFFSNILSSSSVKMSHTPHKLHNNRLLLQDRDARHVILQQIARHARAQIEPFAQKQIAADKQRDLNEVGQRAAKQKELTGSLVDISIKENQGAAAVKAAEKRRQEIEALAQAERFKQEMEGAGRAAAIKSVGQAEAAAI